MNYQQASSYLNSFVNHEKKSKYPYQETFKLERIRALLDVLGDPQNDLKCIHVAGTKGKGSVCSFIAYILKEAGFKVGLYTSPHLSDCRERIRILSLRRRRIRLRRKKPQAEKKDFPGMIPKKEFASLVKRIKPLITEFSRRSKYGALSFFEVYTVLAFIYFKEQKIDFAVLETGLGGRLDATNVIDPLACVITSISYDHMDILGNTLRAIAREKAGIIKRQASKTKSKKLIVVTAPQPDEVLRVLKNKCKQTKASLYEIGKDICFEQSGADCNSQEFNIHGVLGDLKDLKINLLGGYQLINATEAITVVLALSKIHKIRVGQKAIKAGLNNTVWPGRLEIIPRDSLFVLDGAHNVASAHELKKSIKDIYSQKKITLILGISCDKDIFGVCRELVPLCDKLILTRANNLRAAEPKKILLQANKFISPENIFLTDNVASAIKLARKKTGKNSLILLCGSLFLIGEARDLLIKKS